MAEKDQSPSSSIGAYLYSCLYTLHHSDGWNLLQTLVESSINLSRRGIIHRSTLNQEQESESPQSYDCDERQNGTDVDGAKGIPDSSYVDGISAKAVPDFRLELQGNEELNLEQFEQLGAESSDFETMEEPQGAMGGVVTSVSDQDRHWSWEDYEPEEYWDEEDTQPFVMPKPIPQPKKCSESCRKSRYCPNSKENRRLNDSPEQDCGESVPRASGLESLVETADTRRDSEDQDDFVYIPQKNGRKLFVKNISFQVHQRELWTFFEKFGKVEYCELLYHPHRRGKHKGLAKVTFVEKSVADRVLNADPEELVLDGREMYISLCTAKKKVSLPLEIAESHPDEDLSTSSVTQTEALSSGTSSLHDDALLLILEYLTIQERVKLQRVCQRWRHLSRKSLQKVRHISICEVLPFLVTDDRTFKSIMKAGLSNLMSLDLHGRARHLTDKSLDVIGRLCPELTHLDISGMQCTNKGLQAFAKNCTKLQSVKMENCYDLGEDGLWWLFHKCKDLHTLHLGGVYRIHGQCFHVLCHHLKKLILNKCTKLKDVALKKLVLRCQDLEYLAFCDCPNVTPEGIQYLLEAESMKTLKVLHLPQCDSSTVLSKLGGLPLLEEVSFALVSRVTSEVILGLVDGCPNLRVLNLASERYIITDSDLEALAQLPNLQELNISHQNEITDIGLRSLATQGSLTRLEMAYCHQVSDQGVLAVVRSCPNLRRLNVQGCSHLTNDVLSALIELYNIRRETADDCNFTLLLKGTLMSPTQLTIGAGFFIDTDNIPDDSIYQLYYTSSEGSDEEPEILEGNGGIYDFGYSDDDHDDFLDNDDPLAEERWNPS